MQFRTGVLAQHIHVHVWRTFDRIVFKLIFESLAWVPLLAQDACNSKMTGHRVKQMEL